MMQMKKRHFDVETDGFYGAYMQKTDEKFQFEQEIDLLRALFND